MADGLSRGKTRIERIGLTTWSGNQRMVQVAEKIEFVKEATIRKVAIGRGTTTIQLIWSTKK